MGAFPRTKNGKQAALMWVKKLKLESGNSKERFLIK
jgi:hypothetical protein